MSAGLLIVHQVLETYQHHCGEAGAGAMNRKRDDAALCRRLEELVQIGMGCFTMMEMADAAWRRHVARGNRPVDAADDALYRGMFKAWAVETRVLLAAAEPFAARAELLGVEALRAALAGAERKLADWSPPRPTPAIGLRSMQLSAAAAAELDAVAAEAEGRSLALDEPQMQGLTKDDLRRRKLRGRT